MGKARCGRKAEGRVVLAPFSAALSASCSIAPTPAAGGCSTALRPAVAGADARRDPGAPPDANWRRRRNDRPAAGLAAVRPGDRRRWRQLGSLQLPDLHQGDHRPVPSDPQWPRRPVCLGRPAGDHPHDALRVRAEDVRSFTIRAAAVDAPTAYQLYDLDRAAGQRSTRRSLTETDEPRSSQATGSLRAATSSWRQRRGCSAGATTTTYRSCGPAHP